MKGFRWSPQAATDLEETVDYLLEEWGEKSAQKFIDSLERLLKIIKKNPLLFPKSENYSNVHRCLVTKHNTLYYRIEKDEIIILSLWNNHRNP